MQDAWGTPQPKGRPTGLAIGTLVLMVLAFLTLKLLTPNAPTPPAPPADVRADWQSFLTTGKRRWAALQQQIAGRWGNAPAAAPEPSALDVAAAEKIRAELQRRLAARFGVDLDGLKRALPDGWTAALTAPPDSDQHAPAAVLAITQTAPCVSCSNRCLTAPEPLRWYLYPPTASSTVPSRGDCQAMPVATAAAFRLIDPCANAGNCENRAAAYTAAIGFFHPTATRP